MDGVRSGLRSGPNGAKYMIFLALRKWSAPGSSALSASLPCLSYREIWGFFAHYHDIIKP